MRSTLVPFRWIKQTFSLSGPRGFTGKLDKREAISIQPHARPMRFNKHKVSTQGASSSAKSANSQLVWIDVLFSKFWLSSISDVPVSQTLEPFFGRSCGLVCKLKQVGKQLCKLLLCKIFCVFLQNLVSELLFHNRSPDSIQSQGIYSHSRRVQGAFLPPRENP